VLYKLKYMFYLTVVEFISDWYSIHKIAARSSEEMRSVFRRMNKLKGTLRGELEKEINDENV